MYRYVAIWYCTRSRACPSIGRVSRIAAAAAACALSLGCDRSDSVVVYASVDRQLAEPLLRSYEEQFSLSIKPAFDVEANKTVGLVNRLTAEKAVPRADVFWSGEFSRTIELCERGVLGPSPPGLLQPRNAELDDPKGCWFMLAGRLRVFLAYEPSIENIADITSLADLSSPQWRGRACVANPRFGTTGTHFAALLTRWGEARFREWLRDLRSNEVAILPGNAQVKESVSRGACQLGLTDTDDALAALAEGAPVRLVVPDQNDGGTGVFLIPSTVALVAGAPNSSRGTQFLAFLLSEDAERMLAAGTGGFLPIRHPIDGPASLPALNALKTMPTDYVEVARSIPIMLRIVDEEWPR